MPDEYTPVPNIILDAYLPILKPTEVTLLFVIIRQTLGWVDRRTKRRKEKDRLSGSQLRDKTGYSRRAISTAIHKLTEYQLVRVLDYRGNELTSPQKRRGKTCLYYAFNLNIQPPLNPLLNDTCANSAQYLRTFYAQQKKLLQKKMTLTY